MPSRRQVLAGVTAVAATGLTGCSAVLNSQQQAGEGDTIEIIVVNELAETAQVGVRVEDDSGEALFSRVYRLDPGKTNQAAGVDTTPAVIRAFTPTGQTAVWEYNPPSHLHCDGQDIGITLAQGGTIESWYSC